MKHKFPYDGKWHVYTDERLREIGGSTESDIREHIAEYQDSPIKYFLPHSGGLGFCNDYTNGIVMLTAPTRCGKSAHGTVFGLMRTIPCSPDWHCFKKHGMVCPEYRGPRRLVISSYSWGNVEELWLEYQKWCPREMLGRYAQDWGRTEKEYGQPRVLSFSSGRPQRCPLADGSELIFLCDGQAQGAWEGKRWDDGHFDEQREREKFIGYLRGTANTEGLVQAGFTLTGHVLPERPDTGASGWIKNELWDGKYTFGKTVGRYKISMEEVPDTVLSAERKVELYKQWVEEPRKNQDEETIRKAEARFYGGWESGSGLVISNFYPEHHIIPPYNRLHPIVKGATKYRGIDHGLTRPAAAAWAEIFPWGDMVVYREYYERGRIIPYHARRIVELSGNLIIEDGVYEDDEILEPYKSFSEEIGEHGEEYEQSLMDGNSFATPAQERACTIGQLYQDCGLECSPAKMNKNFSKSDPAGGAIPRMKMWFDLDQNRPHIMHQFWKHKIISNELYESWLKDRHGEWRSAPRIYFVSSLKWTFDELRTWAMKNDKPEDKNNHIIGGALKYIIACEPYYVDKGYVPPDDYHAEERRGKYVSW